MGAEGTGKFDAHVSEAAKPHNAHLDDAPEYLMPRNTGIDCVVSFIARRMQVRMAHTAVQDVNDNIGRQGLAPRQPKGNERVGGLVCGKCLGYGKLLSIGLLILIPYFGVAVRTEEYQDGTRLHLHTGSTDTLCNAVPRK